MLLLGNMKSPLDTQKSQLHTIITEQVFVSNKNEQVAKHHNPDMWNFDFRRVLMNGKHNDLITDIFYKQFADTYPLQLGALEVAGVPLVTSMMTKFFHQGHTDINAFFIRKSRKKTGLLRMIEGIVEPNTPIVLVDDIINSGNSFWRQIEILEQLGHRVDIIWTILRFQDMKHYQRFTDRGITVKSLFCLDDFTDNTQDNVHNMLPETVIQNPPLVFEAQWLFQSANPSLSYVNQKSQPILDEKYMYVGSDSGVMYCIDQQDGSVQWSYKTGFHHNRKGIWSSPVLYNNLVIFGSYDGNIYALNKHSGKKVWVNFDADFVGSSPAVNTIDGIVYLGMEFGLVKRQGGIVALDARTGKKVWADYSFPAMTHASPLWIKQHRQVIIGSNEGSIRCYHAKTGKLAWEQKTFAGTNYDWNKHGGFGEGSIAMRPAYDPTHDYIIVGDIAGYLYILERQSGKIIHHHQSEFGIWSTPFVWNNMVFWTTVNKQLHCLNLDTLNHQWTVSPDNTRIFSSPTVINDHLYVGTNAGRLQQINPHNGQITGYFQAVERITNTVIHNPKTDTYFLPTYANEIICLKKTKLKK